MTRETFTAILRSECRVRGCSAKYPSVWNVVGGKEAQGARPVESSLTLKPSCILPRAFREGYALRLRAAISSPSLSFVLVAFRLPFYPYSPSLLLSLSFLPFSLVLFTLALAGSVIPILDLYNTVSAARVSHCLAWTRTIPFHRIVSFSFRCFPSCGIFRVADALLCFHCFRIIPVVELCSNFICRVVQIYRNLENGRRKYLEQFRTIEYFPSYFAHVLPHFVSSLQKTLQKDAIITSNLILPGTRKIFFTMSKKIRCRKNHRHPFSPVSRVFPYPYSFSRTYPVSLTLLSSLESVVRGRSREDRSRTRCRIYFPRRCQPVVASKFIRSNGYAINYNFLWHGPGANWPL